MSCAVSNESNSEFLIPNPKSAGMDPLHGITLEQMINELVEELGWEHMGVLLPINCFLSEPSVKSSLKFLRKTPWARAKLEKMYLERIIDFKKNTN